MDELIIQIQEKEIMYRNPFHQPELMASNPAPTTSGGFTTNGSFGGEISSSRFVASSNPAAAAAAVLMATPEKKMQLSNYIVSGEKQTSRN